MNTVFLTYETTSVLPMRLLLPLAPKLSGLHIKGEIIHQEIDLYTSHLPAKKSLKLCAQSNIVVGKSHCGRFPDSNCFELCLPSACSMLAHCAQHVAYPACSDKLSLEVLASKLEAVSSRNGQVLID